ncbi:MAG: hypothetical protein ITG00_01120 [Flavobacterium sp.]|nr:hypothetical protein [Flavobacterium sp.]
MSEHRKITRVEGDASQTQRPAGTFTATAESKGKALQLRIIAGILWALAIAAQVVAISMVLKPPINMPWVIGLIVIDLVLVVIGSQLWKKSNRLDPASEKNKFMFFMQSQLGLVVSVIAFLPLIIFILTSKKIDGKQKAILGSIAGVALLIAGVTGVDFNPPSVEQYAEQTDRVEWLNDGRDFVYWTKSGTVYHLENDCSYITSAKTSEVFEGTVAQARELKNISNLCSRCENKIIQEKGLNEADYGKAAEEISPSGPELNSGE